MGRRTRRLLAALAAAGTVIVLAASPAGAHPLGNFTVNRHAGIEVSRDDVVVHYIVDMAEIPTFQEIARIDSNGDGTASSSELDAYAARSAARLVRGVELRAGGRPLVLQVGESWARLGDGQGGLDVLRIETTFAAPLQTGRLTLDYEDGNYSGRVGWKEITAHASGGQGIVTSNVPSTSISKELRAYPVDLLSSPPDENAARLTVEPGAGGAASPPDAAAGVESPGALSESLAGLVEHDFSLAWLALALVLAVGFGALHALGPGHGKTVMAAYLVGAGGRLRHALYVGIAVSLMHTASVVALGFVTLWAAELFPPERVYPWLSLVSGVVVLGLGAYLLTARLRARATARREHHNHHDHAQAHHHHDDGFGGHSHGPLEPGASVLSWKGLAALALSGGLLPSPSALVVLLGAVALNRVALGVSLVAAFSVGLAGALTILGALVLRARTLATRRLSGRIGTLLPLYSAGAVLVLGAVLTTRAAAGL